MASKISEASADRMARAVLRGRLGLKSKENVTIECYPSSIPWAAGFVREARRAGAYPIIHYEDESAYWDAAEKGRASVLGKLSEHEKALLEDTDVYVYFWGPEDLARRERLPRKVRDAAVAFNPGWYQVAKKNGVRGARMGIARVTEPNAKHYGVSVDSWQNQLLASSIEDPAKFEKVADRLGKYLSGSGEVHLTHPNGTDLTLKLAHRRVTRATGMLPPKKEWDDFRMMISVPDGSTYTTPDERVAEGTLVANRPTTGSGGLFEGGRWTFEDGRMTSHRFSGGGAAFDAELRTVTGAKDRVALLEIGLDPAIHGAPLMEENEHGAVSVFIGGNRGMGGKNTSSWNNYLTVAGGDLTIDGTSIVRRGRIVV
jgi:aminopeptidase